MRILLETLFFGVAGLGAIGMSGYFLRKKMLPSTPDKCRHKRWSPWKVEKEVAVYLYSEVDEGRGIPDRIDAQLSRVCRNCGLPQSKTIRGIDSVYNK